MPDNTTPRKNRDTTLDLFVTTFPAFRDNLPLAIGVHKIIRERMPELSREQINRALKIHTGSTRYLKVLAKAEQRVDLDGNPAGEITEEQRAQAAGMLKERIRKAAERRKAEEQEKARQARLQQLADKFNTR